MELICREKYKRITELLIRKNIHITTMESCTGGLIASLLTDTEGASSVFKGSFVTYSNEAKVRAGVPEDVISRFGVYSPECARIMAATCTDAFCADIGIGVTGSFSNQDPVNPDSIPGEVFFAICNTVNRSEEEPVFFERHLTGVFRESRLESKLFIADQIADVLLEAINE